MQTTQLRAKAKKQQQKAAKSKIFRDQGATSRARLAIGERFFGGGAGVVSAANDGGIFKLRVPGVASKASDGGTKKDAPVSRSGKSR